MIYGYIRVSTESQTTENQRMQIMQYCKQVKVKNVSWYSETISGTLQPQVRKLGVLLHQLQAGDMIICTELSRLGRSMLMIMNILDECLQKKVKVIAIKENFVLDESIACKALMFAFGLSADIERQLISDRTKAGLAVARAKGKRIGRQKGEKPHYFKLTPFKNQIIEYMNQGRSINSMAREFNVKWKTMSDFCKRNIYVKPLPALTHEPKKHGHPTRREIEWFIAHS